MPEDIAVSPDLERLLEHLDDFTIDEANYQVIQDALEKNNNINVTVLERLLTVCIRDLKEDIMKNPFQALNVLGTLLNKVKVCKNNFTFQHINYLCNYTTFSKSTVILYSTQKLFI